MNTKTTLTTRTQTPLKKFSQSFLSRADEAAFWEAYVGAVLARNGLTVQHNPMLLGEYHDPSASFSCDLVAWLSSDSSIPEDELPFWELEVKSRNIQFTSPADYPWDTVRVCSKSWFRKNWPTENVFGRDFFIVSTRTRAILWIPAGTTALFGTKTTDKERNETYEVVQCKKSDLRSLDDFIRAVRGS